MDFSSHSKGLGVGGGGSRAGPETMILGHCLCSYLSPPWCKCSGSCSNSHPESGGRRRTSSPGSFVSFFLESQGPPDPTVIHKGSWVGLSHDYCWSKAYRGGACPMPAVPAMGGDTGLQSRREMWLVVVLVAMCHYRHTWI